MSIAFDLVKQCLKIFMDDFSVYKDSFDDCLINLEKVMKRCLHKHLTLNWKKKIVILW